MRILSISLLLLALFSCKKSDTRPNQQENKKDISFVNDNAAVSAAATIYSNMLNPQYFTSGSASSLSVLCGLYADELTNYSSSASQAAFEHASLTADNLLVQNSIWNPAWQLIDSANNLIEKLAVSNNVSASVKQQLSGEAKFIRAFCHFYLVNLFGDIPYITTTDSATIYSSHRLLVTEVYPKIISDLLSAQDSLSELFFDETRTAYTPERVCPTKWAAAAMLARAYLYSGDYANAETEATKVIERNGLFTLSAPNSIFLRNSPETIWQLKPVADGINTYEGNIFILTAPPTNVAMNASLAGGFESSDTRKGNWVGQYISGLDTFYFPKKYKVKTSSIVTEYSMVLRLAEQYLIRAEARVRLNKLNEATSDLNIIRARANLQNTTAQTSDELLSAVLAERRLELFTEWGHRWFDLKRLQLANSTLASLKGVNWSSNDILFPIPSAALHSNPNLQQNPGY